MRLPGYLRLFLLLYREGGVELERRRELGFDKNDVNMLVAYGFARVEDGWVILSEKGFRWVEENIIETLFPGYTRQYKHEDIPEEVGV